MTSDAITNTGAVGKAVKRVEDPRLIQGQGSYLEDLHIEGLKDIAFVRSPYAHAKIRSIDSSEAQQIPGVVAVITADDLAHVGSVPVGGNLNIPPCPPLATGVVKFVGDPVVAVVADNIDIAKDAAEAIIIDFEPLPSVVDPFKALEPGAPLVHDMFEDNVVSTAIRETDNVDAEFEAAEHTLAVHVGHGRVAALPIETRGGISVYDSETDSYTMHLSTQAAWTERGDAAKALGVDEEQIRIITPDVGGAFGGKMTLYRETALLLAVSKIVGHPVRWIATRMEDLQTSMHGRGAYTDGEVAYDSDGRIRALKLKTVSNLGSYLMKYSAGPPNRMMLFPTGAYTIPEFRSEIVNVFTNTGPMGPERGAGRPEAAYFIERVVSDVAHALGMDQAEIRRRNFIPESDFPYTNPAGVTYDSGNYLGALERALENINYAETLQEIEQRRQNGEVVGIGIASCVEVSGGGGENGSVTLNQDGTVTIVTGSSPHGQGLATALTQIINDELGISDDAVTITYGDTNVGPRGSGTMGSRSLQLGGNAIRQAASQVRERILSVASEMMEISAADLSIEDGKIVPAGADGQAIDLVDVVANIIQSESLNEGSDSSSSQGIYELAEFKPAGDTYPFGTTIAVVSIDRGTGLPTVERLIGVDDVGNVVNPMLVKGQLLGGIVQGIGEALWEEVTYGDDGQLLSATLMDYAPPKASWLPMIELDRTVTPSPNNPMGVKGVGEAGTVHAPPAIANAVMDALRPFDVEPLDVPLTSQKLWQVIRNGGAGIR